MNEQELIYLSNYKGIKKTPHEPEMYGCGKVYRFYGFYPSLLPIYVMTQHGVSLWDYPQSHDLNSPYPCMLVFSKRMQKAWKKVSSKPCYVIQNPFITYRRKYKIRQQKSARGTLFFFAHSTREIDIKLNIDRLMKQLKNLPDIYKPVSICFHFVDIQKGYYKPFIGKSFECYTAGHDSDPKFMERFYEILSKFRFAMSNGIGSYTFYSVEMGIPFSLYGERPIYYNRADTSFPLGGWDPTKKYKQLTKFIAIFKGLYTEISDKQRNLVRSELGIGDGIGRLKMAKLLYLSYISYSLVLIKGIFYKIKLIIHYILDGSIDKRLYLLINGLIKENNIYTHLTVEEKILLHKILKDQKRDLICVEIGSFLGASACFICNAISKRSKLYCIDTWGNQAMRYTKDDKEEERDTYNEFRMNTVKYKDKIIELRGWSWKMINKLRKLEKKIDFLFIDADHHYNAVKKDWELYSSLLHSGSIVAFHDTGWADGVKRVIKQSVVIKAKKIIELPNMQVYRMH